MLTKAASGTFDHDCTYVHTYVFDGHVLTMCAYVRTVCDVVSTLLLPCKLFGYFAETHAVVVTQAKKEGRLVTYTMWGDSFAICQSVHIASHCTYICSTVCMYM